MAIKEQFTGYLAALQDTICAALEAADGKAVFIEDKWERPEGGGGKTRVIANGDVFEKGGVNTSAVYGALPQAMQQAFGVAGSEFFACGLSLVIHPLNPYVPTVHANWRYFELYDASGATIDSWFGGGTDLTPYYIFEEDARHFHGTLKNTVTPFGAGLYNEYKKKMRRIFRKQAPGHRDAWHRRHIL